MIALVLAIALPIALLSGGGHGAPAGAHAEQDGALAASWSGAGPAPAAASVAGASSDPPQGLRPGSDPRVLPGPVLIADRDNNRLIEISPQGRLLWRFPSPGDLAPGQSFLSPDDAFFSPNGRQVIATQEDDFAISVIDVARRRIVFHYGHPGVPGAEPNYVDNPDDAMLMPSGEILTADIKNCRLLVIRPPVHRPLRQLGVTGDCEHEAGRAFGSPNGAFPMAGGDTAVTEINGDWLDVLNPAGRTLYATHPPGFSYPSDTNEVKPAPDGVDLAPPYSLAARFASTMRAP
jgi:hypothetical protein